MARTVRKPGKGITNTMGANTFPVSGGIGTQTSKTVPKGVATKTKTGKTKYAPTSKANQLPGGKVPKKGAIKKPRKTKRNSYQVKI